MSANNVYQKQKRENSSQAHLNSTLGISQPAKVIDQLNLQKKNALIEVGKGFCRVYLYMYYVPRQISKLIQIELLFHKQMVFGTQALAF